MQNDPLLGRIGSDSPTKILLLESRAEHLAEARL